MSQCKILFDECVPHGLPDGLRLLVAQDAVTFVGDENSPPKGTVDAELLLWCEEHHWLLVTVDRTTMGDAVVAHCANGRHTFGVFILAPDATSGEVLDDLQLIVEASQAEEWIDCFAYLPMYLW
jgi:PIN like domain